MSDSVDILIATRQALRLSSTSYDDEISTLIAAARADMVLSGVLKTKAADDTDPLVRVAIITYVKANWGIDNPDADRYMQAYLAMERDLMDTTEYTS